MRARLGFTCLDVPINRPKNLSLGDLRHFLETIGSTLNPRDSIELGRDSIELGRDSIELGRDSIEIERRMERDQLRYRDDGDGLIGSRGEMGWDG
jgi:hypothetical protein